MKYHVVWAYSSEDLERFVNVKLLLGWTLQGGVCAVQMSNGQYFYQAMTS
jgi:hypothetical protein